MIGREPYLSAARALLRESGCVVVKWRKSMTGVAHITGPLADNWGIEVPEPRGPVSFAVFAHEVGHQLLHRHTRSLRGIEEIEAFDYALAQFDRFNLPGIEKARRDAAVCLAYAGLKITRRKNRRSAEEFLARCPEWVWEHDAVPPELRPLLDEMVTAL